MLHRPRVLLNIILFTLLFQLWGCGASSQKSIETFSFLKAENPSLPKDLVARIDQDNRTMNVVVPHGVNLEGLIATFTTTGVEVRIGDQVQTSGETENDYSFLAAKRYTVYAEDETSQSYDLFLQSGDIAANKAEGFRFSVADNPALPYDIVGAVSHLKGEIELRVPQNSDVTGLVASFNTGAVAVFAQGVEQVSSQTGNDFREPLTYSFLSADGLARDYVVTVNRETCPTNIYEGAYVADSEEDLQALSGYSAVNGWLIIGQASSGRETNLPSLADLSCLNHVEGTLRIVEDNGLTDLSGLNNLFSVSTRLEIDDTAIESLNGLDSFAVSGGLTLKSNPALTGLHGAEALVTANSLNIVGNSISSFIGLDALENVDDITISFAHDLVNFSGLENLTELEGNLTVGTTFGLTNFQGLNNLRQVAGLRVENAPALQSFDGLSSLEQITSLTVEEADQLNTLAGLDSLTTITHGITLENNPQLANLDALSNVTGDFGKLRLVNNPVLVSLAGLAGVTTAEQGVYLENLPQLSSLQGLQNLASTSSIRILTMETLADLDGLANLSYAGSVTLIQCPLLQDIEGLSALTRMDDGGQIWIRENPQLTSLHGLHNATGMRNVTIEYNDGLTNLQGLNSISDTHSVKIQHNPNLTSLAGLDSLVESNFVTVENNPALLSLAGLASLQTNNGLFVEYNDSLTDLTGLEGLVNAGNIYVINNAGLTSFAGLDNLERGLFTIEDNNQLTSIAALKNVSVITSSLTVRNNPVLDIMDFSDLCWIQGSMIFEDNSSLCASDIEALHDQVQACTGIGNQVIIANNGPCM